MNLRTFYYHRILIDIQKIEFFILEKLRKGLDSRLSYHGIHHTIDVMNEAMNISIAENVTDEEELQILKIATLFHDAGFLYLYKDHEERGCKIAQEFLPAFGLNTPQVKRVCGMIMATRIPQKPENFLEQIICDADLDYLGRDDFYSIGKTLYQEWKAFGFVKDELDWNRKQLRFLEAHRYFTNTAIALRGEKKAQHLDEIRNIVAAYKD